MNKKIIALATVFLLVFAACKEEKSNGTSGIPFTIAKNYFIKNNVKIIDNPKIENTKKFNEIFGKVFTSAPDGKPTVIDFSKNYVIAVAKPVTNLKTEMVPLTLKKNKKEELVLTYKHITTEKQTFTTRSSFAIIVDKMHQGTIVLKEVN